MLSENPPQASPTSEGGMENRNFDGFSDTMTTALPPCKAALNTQIPGGLNPSQKPNCQVQPPLNIPTFRRPLVDNFHRTIRRHGTKMRSKVKKAAKCVVCGERASGMYFGALVCLPCKSFFIRCTKDGKPQLTCLGDKNCSIDRSNRMRCQYCRYKKCLSAGMMRREKPETVEPGEGQELCKVCADIANGIHFGVMTCEGCKKFFRRALKEADTYDCKHQKICTLNPRNRNACRYCRYRKCINVGMSRQAIRMGRPKKVKAENDGLYDGYGGFDCYYSDPSTQFYGHMTHHPQKHIPPALTIPHYTSSTQNQSYKFLSCSSDDSGIESDAASSPPAVANSPGLLDTSIKSEPYDFFGASSCSRDMGYDKNKLLDNLHQNQKFTITPKDVDMKNGVVDLEDFFLADPVEMDTEDMNDVLTTLGQFLGNMGQSPPMNTNSSTSPTNGSYSLSQFGAATDKFVSTYPQQSYLESLSKPLTYQATYHVQDYSQHSSNRDMQPYGHYKEWQSSNQCSQPYFCEQSTLSQRQGGFPCYSR